MTAEIAVMNKNGIALAADSAVTITGPAGQKIYNTHKLFMLSKYHPVGVMIFGNAELLDMEVDLLKGGATASPFFAKKSWSASLHKAVTGTGFAWKQ